MISVELIGIQVDPISGAAALVLREHDAPNRLLPIVATRVDGAVDAIVPGENGWLVDVGDTKGMARHLLELAADPTRARAMGAAGLRRVEEFSAARMVKNLQILYRRMTGGDGGEIDVNRASR